MTPKEKLINAVRERISKKDVCSEEREIWELESVLDLIEEILPPNKDIEQYTQNTLSKLVQQYEKENPGKYAEIMDYGCKGYEEEFVQWQAGQIKTLASRPTCGKEQRNFLDEVEKLEYSGNGLMKKESYYLAIVEDCFESNLEEVARGE